MPGPPPESIGQVTDPSVGDEPNIDTKPTATKVPANLFPPLQHGMTNRHVPPEKWAMTHVQWRFFLEACKQVHVIWATATGSKCYANLYDLNKNFVKPWTRGTGTSVALRMNQDSPLRARLMLSHSWAEDVDECGQALESYLAHAKLASDVPVWFCLYSNYQPGSDVGDPGPTIQEQLEMDPFGSVIQCVGQDLGHGLIVVHTSTAELYDRLWCVYEIAVALNAGISTVPVCSDPYLRASRGKLLDILQVSTVGAECSCDGDRQTITRKVHEQGGFSKLDDMIFTFRIKMLRDLAESRAKLRGGTSMDLLQSMQGEFEQAEAHIFGKQRTRRPSRRFPALALVLFLVFLVASTIAIIVFALTHGRGQPPTTSSKQPQFEESIIGKDSDSDETRDVHSAPTFPSLFEDIVVPVVVLAFAAGTIGLLVCLRQSRRCARAGPEVEAAGDDGSAELLAERLAAARRILAARESAAPEEPK